MTGGDALDSRHIRFEKPYVDRSGRLDERYQDVEPRPGNPVKAAETALRNGSLQGAYLMIAARALGFDIGGISGFDNAKVDQAFLSGTTFRSNFLCAIGHADEAGLFQRLPRYAFDEVCKII